MTAADAAVYAAADRLAEKVEGFITHRTVESGRRRRSDWGQGVVGSNPAIPTNFFKVGQ
jgi:hypothetical protein